MSNSDESFINQNAEEKLLEQFCDKYRKLFICFLMLIHSSLLGYSAVRNSWTWDEVAFLPAGISHWKFCDFELFDVNPPLVRMVAAIPVLFADPILDWEGHTTNPTVRPERPIGERFLRNNGRRSFWLLTLARWACIPFSLIGGFVCYHWSRRLFGTASGILALFLWTFAPTIIAHGQLMTADIGGASLGILGFYVFWLWLHDCSWRKTLILGVVMGLLELAKTTWVILFGLWPLIWLIWRVSCRRENERGWLLREGGRLAVSFVLAVYFLNMGYGFQGTGTPLGEYEFISNGIGGPIAPEDVGRGQIPGYPSSFPGSIRNRFQGTILGHLPVPLPKKYVEGIDRQKSHFEVTNWSYLGGEWKQGGWLYYYLYALSLKTSLGIWLVGIAALIGALKFAAMRGRLRDYLFLFGSMTLLVMFVSLQTGINRHVRYVLPAFPFAFILMSSAARFVTKPHPRLSFLVGGGCCWLIAGSLATFPHHLSYFNELAAGPKNGGRFLASSNVDWGQDLLHLEQWLVEHPEVELDGLGWHCRVVDPKIVGIEGKPIPRTPISGWYALSVLKIHQRGDAFTYFKHLEPVGWAGYSIPIFHITSQQAKELQAFSPALESSAKAVSTLDHPAPESSSVPK